MGFKPAPNIEGRVFVPDETPPARRKHPCPDCFRCQMCSEDRCRICRAQRPCHADRSRTARQCPFTADSE